MKVAICDYTGRIYPKDEDIEIEWSEFVVLANEYHKYEKIVVGSFIDPETMSVYIEEDWG